MKTSIRRAGRSELATNLACGLPGCFEGGMLRVIGPVLCGLLVNCHELLAAEEVEPLLQRLDPPTRGRVVLALAGLVMLGVFLLLLVWLGFRFLRRRQREFHEEVQGRNRRPYDPDDWARRSSPPPDVALLDDGSSTDKI